MLVKIVVALGGNALLRRGEPMTEEAQKRNVEVAARAVATLARNHQVVVTHGNGPQVGLLALASEAYTGGPAFGLDILGAESQGMIGFMLEQALRNELPATPVATLLTSVRVDRDDPAFGAPTKFIGPGYSAEEAQELAQQRGWTFARDGDRVRRVVPSPEPKAVLELDAVRILSDAGCLVVCGGGGGVPVIRDDAGSLTGVEGVIDKDLTSALLAEQLGADRLLLLTDVEVVQTGWGTGMAHPLRETTAKTLRHLSFEPGSMGPKVEAACRFVERTGHAAAIGALSDAESLLTYDAGTQVLPCP
jgi:carbamate kinase